MHKTQLINKTLDLHLAEIKRKSSLKWSSFNFLILSVLVFDIYKTDNISDKFYWIEVTASIIILCSLLKNILTYLYYTWFNEEIACENEEQRILLSLNKSNSFVKAPSNKLCKQETNDMLTGNIRNLSWQNYGEREYLHYYSLISYFISHYFSKHIKFESTNKLDE